MDLKELLGDKYKDGMTVEEIQAALADLNLVDPATLPKSVDKTTFDKTASELAQTKRDLAAKMTEEEANAAAAEAAQAAMKAELEGLRREKTISEYTAEYLALGYEQSLAAETATAFADGDMKTFFTNQRKANEFAAAALKKEALQNTQAPPAGEKGRTDKEKFSKMTLSEKMALKVDDPDTFNILTETGGKN
jgi:hypothetical protein